jgi:hypothetical protein
MRQFWGWFQRHASDATIGADEQSPAVILTFPSGSWSRDRCDTAIRLSSCTPFERILVKTRMSVYEIIVLSPRIGEVLIRGGRFFPEFTRALLSGSTIGGSALKLRTIETGGRLELRVGDQIFTTSTVQDASRQ